MNQMKQGLIIYHDSEASLKEVSLKWSGDGIFNYTIILSDHMIQTE